MFVRLSISTKERRVTKPYGSSPASYQRGGKYPTLQQHGMQSGAFRKSRPDQNQSFSHRLPLEFKRPAICLPPRHSDLTTPQGLNDGVHDSQTFFYVKVMQTSMHVLQNPRVKPHVRLHTRKMEYTGICFCFWSRSFSIVRAYPIFFLGDTLSYRRRL